MRKYFLLSAIALMAATTANATTDYAEVTAKATIQVAGTFSCTNMNWGTIVVKQGNAEAIIESTTGLNAYTESSDILSITGASYATCSGYENQEDEIFNLPTSVTLTNDNGDTMTYRPANELVSGDSNITGTLIVPPNVKAGEYTGSFTVTHTY